MVYNLFMPEEQHEITVVVVSCPKCARKFKTLLCIAEKTQPVCPNCDCEMSFAQAAEA